jgi:serine/threonine-protein kinase
MKPTQPDMTGATAEFSPNSLLGQTFGGKYRIISELSQGGMGRIYRAEQIALKRPVAIKVIISDDDPVANKRFLLEASLTANLVHPNIVKIYDFGRTSEGMLFLVMELLEGENLEAWTEHNGPLSCKEALQVGVQLCGALTEAHRKNVVHRDIKPANIVVSRRPGGDLTATLIDFGLVKSAGQGGGLSRTGMIVGTPMYMAPEQLSATGVDDRVDIYALGLTLFFSLTGRDPYPGRGLDSLMMAQLHEQLEAVSEVNPEVEGEHLINWVVQTAIAKDPMHRFQNALQLQQALEACKGKLPSGEYPTLSFDQGVLSSQTPIDALDNEVPSTPLVDSTTYVKDGSAISTEFADALSLSGVIDPSEAPNRFDSTTSLEFTGHTPTSGVTQRTSVPMIPILAVLVVLGLAGWWSTQTQPASETGATQAQAVEVEVKSVPEGADVLLDDTLVGSTPFKISVGSGEITHIELRLTGHEPRKVALSSRTPTVTIRLTSIDPEPTATTVPAVAPAAVTPAPKRARPTRKAQPTPQPSPTPSVTPPAEDTPPANTADGLRDPWAD